MKSTYKPKSFQKFHLAVGQTTAYATGTHLCLSYAITNKVSQSEWTKIAISEQIRVDNLDLEKLLSSNINQSIVSLYSAFDEFLSCLGKEYQSAHEGNWVKNQEDTPYETILRNSIKEKSIEELKHKFILFDYYRKLRNWIVHPRSKDFEKIGKWHEQNKSKIKELGLLFGMSGAPNNPELLQIHDMKLFCQLVLDIATQVSEAYDPGNEVLAKLVRKDFSVDQNANPERVKNSIIGYIRTNFGLSDSRAIEVYEIVTA